MLKPAVQTQATRYTCVAKETNIHLRFVSWQANLLGLQALLSANLHLLRQLKPPIEQELVSSFNSLVRFDTFQMFRVNAMSRDVQGSGGWRGSLWYGPPS